MFQDNLLSLLIAVIPAFIAFFGTRFLAHIIDKNRYKESPRSKYISNKSCRRSDKGRFSKRLLDSNSIIYFCMSTGALTFTLFNLLNNGFKYISMNPILSSLSSFFFELSLLKLKIILVIIVINLSVSIISASCYFILSSKHLSGRWIQNIGFSLTLFFFTGISMLLFNITILYISGDASS